MRLYSRSAVSLTTILTVFWAATARAQSQCFGSQFNTYYDGFRYTASLSLNDCQSSQLNISRLVLEGACSNTYNNNFDSYPRCNNGGVNIVASGASECNTFFSQASEDAIIRRPSSGEFDSERVCSDSNTAFIFVQTNCSSFSISQVKLATSTYGRGFCWNGRTLSAGAAAGIAIGCGIAVFVIVFLGVRFGCRRRQAQILNPTHQPYVSNISMEPYPQQPAYVYGQPASNQPATGYPAQDFQSANGQNQVPPGKYQNAYPY